jgi:DNA ligase-1
MTSFTLPFSDLVAVFQKVETTSKRLEMAALLSDLFRRADACEIDQILYFLQGELLPPFHGVTLGLSEKYLLRALSRYSGVALENLETEFRSVGDIGVLAELHTAASGQDQSSRAMGEVYRAIFDLTHFSGEGSVEQKLDALVDLFNPCTPIEAKYIARFIAGKLRLGVGDATLLDALSLDWADRLLRPILSGRLRLGVDDDTLLRALAPPFASVAIRPVLERAYAITSDLGLIAKTLYTSGEEALRTLTVRVGYPIRPALCERASSAEEILERMGRCAVEVKYDGFRCQLHQSPQEVVLFSRNQERTTAMFPEIVEAARRSFSGREIILEGEALAFNEATGEILPFQTTIQRKRKHGVEEMSRNFPLKFFVFDLLYLDGEDWTKRPYAARREKIVELLRESGESGEGVLCLAEAIQSDDPGEIEAFFDSAVGRRLEGIVAKRLNAPYSAGARDFNWIKLKRSYRLADSIDLCIVGYWAGKGARARLGIGTILGAVYDEASDRFLTASKVGSGFSEEELIRLKALLDEAAASEPPASVVSEIVPEVWVHPKYVVTVTADEISRSSNHTAGKTYDDEGKPDDEPGYALRFPRAIGFVRDDKSARDATTVDEIVSLFQKQTVKKASSAP